jgi:hypothetical protein
VAPSVVSNIVMSPNICLFIIIRFPKSRYIINRIEYMNSIKSRRFKKVVSKLIAAKPNLTYKQIIFKAKQMISGT